MSDPREPAWQQTLGDVGHAVAACLDSLDRYETAFAPLLGEAPAAPARPVPVASADRWDARLAAAREGVEAVDRLLAGSEMAWATWAAEFSAWRRGVEQPPANTLGSVPNVEVRGDPAGGGPLDPVRRA